MTVASLLVAFALIAANGFFVGAEFAVLAARRSRLEPLLRASRRARTAVRSIEQLRACSHRYAVGEACTHARRRGR